LIETHMINEESNVFPLIKKYEVSPNESLKQNILEATSKMEHEHEICVNLIKQMREVTSDYEPPLNACGSYRVTYARLKDLESDTLNHIHLENNILFNRLYIVLHLIRTTSKVVQFRSTNHKIVPL